MRYTINHSGKRYGFLVALRDVGSKQKSRMWECVCDCGNKIIVKSYDLGPSRGRKSCGCESLTIGDVTRTHGMSDHPAYLVWQAMKNRCYREKDTGYFNYGARGITVCVRWRQGFKNFWKDMGATYETGLTLERRKNNRGYSKKNCYWATRLVQGQNKRSNHMLKTPWGFICLAEAARRSKICLSTLKRRIARGVSGDDLFKVPK